MNHRSISETFDGAEGPVELSMPAIPDLLSLPRLVAAALSARGGFDIEEVEDIRLAIEELCLSSFEGRGQGRLFLRMGIHGHALEVECSFEPELQRSPSTTRNALASNLTEQLLDALTDEHGSTVEEGTSRAWFRKTLGGPPTE